MFLKIRDFTNRERIDRAAIAYRSEVWSLPWPARHNHIIAAYYSVHDLETRADDVQGFITTTGRFVDRKTALRIAERAGQIIEKHGNESLLFSEDLW